MRTMNFDKMEKMPLWELDHHLSYLLSERSCYTICRDTWQGQIDDAKKELDLASGTHNMSDAIDKVKLCDERLAPLVEDYNKKTKELDGCIIPVFDIYHRKNMEKKGLDSHGLQKANLEEVRGKSAISSDTCITWPNGDSYKMPDVSEANKKLFKPANFLWCVNPATLNEASLDALNVSPKVPVDRDHYNELFKMFAMGGALCFDKDQLWVNLDKELTYEQKEMMFDNISSISSDVFTVHLVNEKGDCCGMAYNARTITADRLLNDIETKQCENKEMEKNHNKQKHRGEER